MAHGNWKVFDVDALIRECEATGQPYFEFLRVPSLSCGVYRLPAGAQDLQAPHDEDEVYHVLSGRARIRLEGAERLVGPGSVMYVQATAEHSFIEILEDVTLLVFFASGGPAG